MHSRASRVYRASRTDRPFGNSSGFGWNRPSTGNVLIVTRDNVTLLFLSPTALRPSFPPAPPLPMVAALGGVLTRSPAATTAVANSLFRWFALQPATHPRVQYSATLYSRPWPVCAAVTPTLARLTRRSLVYPATLSSTLGCSDDDRARFVLAPLRIPMNVHSPLLTSPLDVHPATLVLMPTPVTCALVRSIRGLLALVSQPQTTCVRSPHLCSPSFVLPRPFRASHSPSAPSFVPPHARSPSRASVPHPPRPFAPRRVRPPPSAFFRFPLRWFAFPRLATARVRSPSPASLRLDPRAFVPLSVSDADTTYPAPVFVAHPVVRPLPTFASGADPPTPG
ncbi:hypothetical protein R3P38DRAFT_3212276 [Favolaschia claudopus]|uniref:Uncharacterized protein n=1 Tax=Favolaschia claudopus TaxID=2862362 RepID=A0AAW0AED9_9AGAR